MSDLAVRPSITYSQILSTSLTVVCLFSLLGLAITAAVLPLFAPEDISWVLAHIE
jgi:hypothetical protein